MKKIAGEQTYELTIEEIAKLLKIDEPITKIWCDDYDGYNDKMPSKVWVTVKSG